MPDTALDPVPTQGKFRRALAAVGAWLQALDYNAAARRQRSAVERQG